MAWWTPILLAAAQAQEPTAGDVEFFEKEVRPLLDARCFECHGPEVRKPKGGLRLHSAEAWLTGGKEGPALIPGDAEASLLVQRIRSSYEDERMPPEQPLTDAEVAVLVRWVQMGAPAPSAQVAAVEEIDWEAARDFWSLQPVRDPAPPAVGDALWGANEVDRFVLAGLERAGLSPAPEADRRTLLRRASFILTGLPPTPDEMDAFLHDTQPGAWDRVIERLLASPHYGEQWGRHWLDLARYSDSNGLDENLTYGNAWRYRDYVVRAFNADKPYDRFVMEQIAGDLLPEMEDPAQQADQLAALTFLALGPKMLAEQDKEKLVYDTVDEQIDVWSKTFLGLTVSCARCHDHKFDPISAQDYYALAGVFKSTRAFDGIDHVSAWAEREIGSAAEVLRAREHAESMAAAKQAAEAALAAAQKASEQAEREGVASALLAAETLRGRAILREATAADATSLGADRSNWGSDLDPVLHTIGGGEQFAEYRVTLPQAGRWRLEVRYASGEERPVRVTWDGAMLNEAALRERTGGFMPEHQAWAVVKDFGAQAGEHVLRLADAPHFPHLSRILLTPLPRTGASEAPPPPTAEAPAAPAWAAVLARAGGDDPVWAPWLAMSANGAEGLAGLRERAAAGALTLAPAALAVLGVPAPDGLSDLAALYQVGFALSERPPVPLSREERAALAPAALRTAAAERRDELARIGAQAPPPLPRVMTVREADAPADVPVLHRGDHLAPRGAPVPRAAPTAASFHLPMEAVPAGASGRLQLARWTADPGNPLTARVMVNRIWQHHFGRGIVASPSNFGLRGDAPANPALLDWLAARFIASGWSVKEMHRLLMRSMAWRMDSAWDAGAAEADPANQLLWRREPRRLDAEEVRDALLAVSGRLDPTLGGSLLLTANRDYVNNDQSANLVDYDKPRRSLYLPVVRNAIYEVFSIFDFNDPSVPVESRPRTTVAHQALFAANAPLVRDSAAALALRARAIGADAVALAGADPHAIEPALRAVFRLAWQRTPEDDELAAARVWLEREIGLAGEDEAWIRFAHAMLMASEFYILD